MKKILIVLFLAVGMFAAASSAQAAPTVKIISPNGGETVKTGDKVHITWDSTNVDKVTLGYSTGPSNTNYIAYNVPNSGSYDWTVNVGNTTNTQFKINILAYQTGVGSVEDYSDGFFTVNPLTVLSTATTTINNGYTGPLVSSIEPNVGPPGTRVTVIGSGFNADGLLVRMGNVPMPSQYYQVSSDGKQISFIVSTEVVWQPGVTYAVVVLNIKGASQNIAFTVSPATASIQPVTTSTVANISSYGPSPVVAGGVMALYGSNFKEGAIIILDGNTNESINPAYLTERGVNFLVPLNLSGGTHYAQIKSKDGELSNKISFEAVGATTLSAPSVSSIVPMSAKAGDTVYIYGSNFGLDTYVIFDANKIVEPDKTPGSGALFFTIPLTMSEGEHLVQVGGKTGRSNIMPINIKAGLTPTVQDVEIKSFTVSDPKLKASQDVTLFWQTSTDVKARIDFTCSDTAIKLLMPEDGRILNCDKGGVVHYDQPQHTASFNLRPQENSKNTSVTFVLRVLEKDGSETNQSKSVTVNFTPIASSISVPATVQPTTPNNTVYNQKIAELLKLVASLQAQLAQIKKGQEARPTCVPITFSSNLSLGDGEGDDGLAAEIKTLQKFLKSKGYYNANITGYFGKITKAGVVRFQKARGIVQTGELDDATVIKINEGCTQTIGAGSTVSSDRELAKVRNTKRWSNVNTILNSISQNMADNRGDFVCAAGALPGISTEMGREGYNIEGCIAPTYISGMPADPITGTGANTNYYVSYNSTTRRVTVSAPKAELGEVISVTR